MICSYEVFDMMKHSKKALLSLTALAASAVVLFSGCADEAASGSTAPAAGSETTAASSAAQASSQSTELLSSLTTKELEELVSGDVTLAQLEKERLGITETPSAASTTTSSAASSKQTTPSTANRKKNSSTSSSKTTTTTASASYEDEIQNLLNQLYAVKAKAESGLNSAIQSAKNEYYALPDDQKSQAKKISIVMGKASELQNLQSTCDAEVNRIVEQMRKVLRANGQSTALADQALASYEAQKESTYASLKSKLLG